MGIFTESRREQPTPNIRSGKVKWTGQTMRRDCLPKQVIEGNIGRLMEAKGRRGKRRKLLQSDLKENNTGN